MIFEYNFNKLNYLANISASKNILYMETPKVCCSTIKKYLQIIETNGDYSLLPDNVHDKVNSPLKSPSEIELPISRLFSGDEFLRFSFVRNPFTRVLSAYLDKIVQNQWERHRHLPALGFNRGANVGFREFLERIHAQPPLERDIHFMSQYDILRPDRVKYHFLGNFEKFSHDYSHLQDLISATATIRDSSINWHATNASNRIGEYYGEIETTLVRTIYINDFIYFGYSMELSDIR
ncbi:sulfotransferase family 2 domain-containing protein [Rhizobiales bacterium]|uniref:sulfotransferase family protein n=1 Tax=Hongsoonwoonella zoysiae TaxID=2821844 RepID=UPI00155F7D91|nr:sulfotransferase family protein [Hongsoonwoonella zoysiae]NRG18540.1 sulfotransferase family 2 domain-containing protein [Hongsoonwoonella zoysiae]